MRGYCTRRLDWVWLIIFIFSRIAVFWLLKYTLIGTSVTQCTNTASLKMVFEVFGIQIGAPTLSTIMKVWVLRYLDTGQVCGSYKL